MKTLKWINEKQVAAMTGRAAQTLRNDRFKRQGIPYSKFGRSIRYNIDDVVHFMNSNRISFSEN